MVNDQNAVPTQEELAAETAGLREVKEEEVRAEIITDYGFDEVEDAERIDKAVAKEIKHRKDISTAIGQKIKHRNEANELRKVEPPKKEPLKEPAMPEKESFSLKDSRALTDVHDDDVDDVVDYAKFKGISIPEAKKAPAMVNLLKAKAEERATAEAANAGPSRRGSSDVSVEALTEKANKGELQDSEFDRLAEARIEQKRKHTK